MATDPTTIPSVEDLQETKAYMEDINEFVSSSNNNLVDSDGKTRKTLTGVINESNTLISQIEKQGNDAVRNYNITPAFDFATGFTIQTRNQAGIDSNGDYWIYDGEIPVSGYVVTAGTVPTVADYTKFISSVITDSSIWGDRYRGSFASGFDFTNITDVGRGQDGKYYSYAGSDPFPVTVVAGTIPTAPDYIEAELDTLTRTNASNNLQYQPNVISGSVGNRIDPTTSASTIAGGGGFTDSTRNRIGEDADGRAFVSTIGGGYDNEINCQASTISGGAHHLIDTVEGHSNIAGGSYGQVIGEANYCAILSGTLNTINNAGFSIIGGSSNSIDGSLSPTPKVFGAGILSGRNNSITGINASVYGEYSVVVGGSNNDITGRYSSLFGGFNNDITSSYSLSGGDRNTVRRDYSVGFGSQNDVGIAYSFVSGEGNSVTETAGKVHALCLGRNSTITDCNFATILKADNSSVLSDYSMVAAGVNNNITAGTYSTIVNGIGNTVTASNCIVFGVNNTASNIFSTVIGQESISYNYGERVTGNGKLRNIGDCQRSTNILRQKTTGAEVKRLTPDGGTGTTYFIPDLSTVVIKGNLVAKRSIGSGVSDRVVWDIELVVSKGSNGTAVIIDLNTVTELFASTATKPSFLITPETTNAVKFEVTGVTGQNWDFSCSIDINTIVDSV